MALPDVIDRRLRIFFYRTVGVWVPLPANPALKDPPLGIQSTLLPELRGRLNDNVSGFADVLKPGSIIAQSEVKLSSKLSDLAIAILAKSHVQNLDQYAVKQLERVRLAIRDAIVDLAGVDPQDVLPTSCIDDFLPDPDAVMAIRESLQDKLVKYLFSTIRASDVDGTVGKAVGRITGRTLIL